VRSLELAAGRLVANPSAGRDDDKLLREQFTRWAANDARFQPLAEGDILLAELRPLSKDLSALGAMGLQALDYLEGAQPAPANWVSDQSREVTRMLKPNVEVILAAARPVKLLLDQLARKPQ